MTFKTILVPGVPWPGKDTHIRSRRMPAPRDQKEIDRNFAKWLLENDLMPKSKKPNA